VKGLGCTLKGCDPGVWDVGELGKAGMSSFEHMQHVTFRYQGAAAVEPALEDFTISRPLESP
jgi:hypothetical protein